MESPGRGVDPLPNETYTERTTLLSPPEADVHGKQLMVRKVVGVAVVASLAAMLMPTLAQAAPKRRLTIADAAVIEGDTGTTALSFRIVYSGKPSNGITVDWATSAGSATAGVDYTAAWGTASFPNGGCRCADVVVDVLGDLEEEAAETLTVSLSNPAIATIADGSATGTIFDDDGPPAIVILDVVVDESAGNASFDVMLTSSDVDTVTADYATADGTAVAGSDYTTASGTVTFLPGDMIETVDVPLLDDDVAEEEQAFTLNLSNPVEATFDRDAALGTIVDTDADPAITVADSSIVEGDAGSSNGTVTVSLSAASEKTIEVDYATSDGSASAASDYIAATGTLTFAPGDTEEQVDVAVLGDTAEEGDETVVVDLSGESNATVSDGGGVLTISDDDASAPTATALTVKVVKRTKKVLARGVLEAAEDGAEVRVVLQVRRDGRFHRVAAKRVGVAIVTDRDGDSIADASYKAGFARPKAGRYRFRIVFTGTVQLEGSVAMKRFRL